MFRILGSVLAVAALSACVPATPDGESVDLSPEVRALVGPGQDTSTARIESDGCYWYLHRGPVETTYIPLLTREARMICTRPQS
jgi:hypothetical protein